MLEVDISTCTGCGLCAKNCPFEAIVVVNEIAEVQENCTLCGACVNVCPQNSLSIERKAPSPEDLAQYKHVWVLAETATRDDKIILKNVTLELLGKGRELSDKLGEQLSAVILGKDVSHLTQELIDYGADTVYLCQHDLLENYSTDAYANVISSLISKEKPSIILYGATPNGRDLAPRIAARLKLGLTADCTGLDIDDERQLIQTRPAFGGNIMASILSPYTRPQMATVRPNVFKKPLKTPDRKGTKFEIPVKLSRAAIRTKYVEFIATETEGDTKIDEAKILVSAGRGIVIQENLKMIKELAEALNGTLASSRALVDLGWTPHTIQVGQSGTTVNPQLYIAIGISGAVQHLVGMSSSDLIIAINKDPEAPIFKIADFGIIGDMAQIIPLLIKKLKEKKTKAQP